MSENNPPDEQSADIDARLTALNNMIDTAYGAVPSTPTPIDAMIVSGRTSYNEPDPFTGTPQQLANRHMAEHNEMREVMPPVYPESTASTTAGFIPKTMDQYKAEQLGYTISSPDYNAAEIQLHAAIVAEQAQLSPTPTMTGKLINEMLANVRAPFDAKKKRGNEFKGARTRLDKLADEAVRVFARKHLDGAITEEQAISISTGVAGIVGNDVEGFTYAEGAQ